MCFNYVDLGGARDVRVVCWTCCPLFAPLPDFGSRIHSMLVPPVLVEHVPCVRSSGAHDRCVEIFYAPMKLLDHGPDPMPVRVSMSSEDVSRVYLGYVTHGIWDSSVLSFGWVCGLLVGSSPETAATRWEYDKR